MSQAARNGFCSQVKSLSEVERETSITTNKRVDLARTALYIAAEDDSLISHSSVPLPVEAFLERLDDLSMGYCSHFGSSLKSSPEIFLECMDTYLYINKVSLRTVPSVLNLYIIQNLVLLFIFLKFYLVTNA